MDSLAPEHPLGGAKEDTQGNGTRTAPPGGAQTHLFLAPGRGVTGGVFGLPQRHPLPTTVKSDHGLDGVVWWEEEEELTGSG